MEREGQAISRSVETTFIAMSLQPARKLTEWIPATDTWLIRSGAVTPDPHIYCKAQSMLSVRTVSW